MSRYDVLVLGEPLLERHADHDGNPVAADSVSGDAFNAACAAALAGARVALLTALGRDEGGDRVMAELERRGIGTEHIYRDDRPTGAYTVAPDAQGRTAFSYQRAGSAASALEPGHLARWTPVVEATPVLVTGGICAALSAGTEALVHEAAARAAGAGRVVCYDVNFRPRLTRAADALRALTSVAPHAGVIKIATPADSEPLLSRTAAPDVIAVLRGLTGAAVIVTDGEHPLTLSEGGVDTVYPVLPAPAFLDATGAGDVLLGTLAAALARGLHVNGGVGGAVGGGAGGGVAAGLLEAMAAAALSTGHRGGAPHATREEVLAVLMDHT